jgi:beta-lactamase regulating signal transducer with metallopeptidase domain
MTPEPTDWFSIAWVQIWQIGVLAILVASLNFLIARRRPHLAYALWLVVLAKCFVPPLSHSPVSMSGITAPPDFWKSWHDDRPAANANTNASLTEAADVTSQPAIEEAPRTSESASNDRTATARRPQQLPVATSISVRTAAGFLWLSGSLLLCGIAIGRSSIVNQRLRRTAEPISEEFMLLVAQISQQMGLRQQARVRQTSADIGPIVIGVRRPTVFIPTFLLEQLPRPQSAAMLAHELAHLRRRDVWAAAVQFVAQCVWWFHPAVWWMNFQITRQRERCCDEEVVVGLSGKRADYARLLVAVLEANHRLEPLWMCPAVRPVELTRRRLEEIMKRKNMMYARSPRWVWLIAASLASVVLWSSGHSAAKDAPDSSDDIRVAQSTQDSQRTQSTGVTSPRATSGDRPPALLSYGDGKADGKKSYGGSGHMIRFEMPEGISKVRGLRIHGSRYGVPQAPDEDFEMTFLSDDRQEILDSQVAPYRLFKRGKEAWVRVLFDEEVELPEKFWVALNFNPHQTKGIYVSYDASTKGEYSRVGLPGDEEEPTQTDFGGDWMVQVMLSRPAK